MSKRDASNDADSFYISWGDLVSLLLVFFIYLFSISEIDYVKFLEAKQSMQNEIVVETEDLMLQQLRLEYKKLENMEQKIESYIEDEELQDVLSVNYLDDRLELNMGNVLLFDLGAASLKAKAQDVLKQVGHLFADSDSKIVIEGHTDDIPIATPQFPSNWELSSSRAASVVRFLTSTGVPEHRFVVIGYNQFIPLAPNDNETNRSKNRRVKITIQPDVERIRQDVLKQKEVLEKSLNQEVSLR